MEYRKETGMLDKLANVATVLLVLFAIVFGIYHWNVGKPQKPKPDYKVGDVVKDLKFEVTGKTLVLVSRSTCPHCVVDLPKIKKLSDHGRARGYKLVSISAEDIEVHRRWLMDAGITPDQIITRQMSGLNISGTPTTLVMDKGNKVLFFASGELSEQATTEVAALLK
jgi:thiol-disulfide isomerase/thioredoxin